MDVQQLAPGLWHWTARHPTLDDAILGSDVGCVYAETADAVVLIDPLVPDDERDRFLAALDRDVERLARPVVILETCAWHARSAPELRERYGAGHDPPPDAVARPVADDEVVWWLSAHRALVAGDALLGVDGLQRCPDAWVAERGGAERFVDALRGLLQLDAEFVLPSHGAPVIGDGTAALARAIASPLDV